MRWRTSFHVGDREIGRNSPTYFIADIASNHDGDLSRAKDLIKRAKDAGAHCAKFQHFKADKIVSAKGFDGIKVAHQALWDKPVVEVYEQYSLNREWNEELWRTCEDNHIDFMTTPYDAEAITGVDLLVHAYKIGSGDVTFHALIEQIALQHKPTFLATGASTMGEVIEAVDKYLRLNANLCLMQCNTNYTGAMDNFSCVNLNVLRSYATAFPGLPLGLSDHTPGHAVVLGAVALGARVVEKHFTDDRTRVGPDHNFALEPDDWMKMAIEVAILEEALGDGVKRVEHNEAESRVIQRRALRVKRDMKSGDVVQRGDLEALRPCPPDALPPSEIESAIGGVLRCDVAAGEALTYSNIF